MMRSSGVALLFLVTGLAACAARPAFEGGRAWEEGWREGTVEKVGPAADLGYRQSYDCRYRNGDGRDASGQFAVVGLRNGGNHRHHVVPVTAGNEPAVGARVLTKWRSCDALVLVGG